MRCGLCALLVFISQWISSQPFDLTVPAKERDPREHDYPWGIFRLHARQSKQWKEPSSLGEKTCILVPTTPVTACDLGAQQFFTLSPASSSINRNLTRPHLTRWLWGLNEVKDIQHTTSWHLITVSYFGLFVYLFFAYFSLRLYYSYGLQHSKFLIKVEWMNGWMVTQKISQRSISLHVKSILKKNFLTMSWFCILTKKYPVFSCRRDYFLQYFLWIFYHLYFNNNRR